MFGNSSEEAKLYKAMKSAGADMSVVRRWQKTAEKIRKTMPQTAGAYRAAHDALERAYRAAEKLERVFVLTDPERLEKKDFEPLIFELKRLSGAFDHALVVSEDDSDFHMTYGTVIRLGEAYGKNPGERLILQSEIENLLSLMKELLDRETLTDCEVACYYCGRTDAGLSSLSPQERLDKVHRIFWKEFMGDMQRQTAACMEQSRNRSGSLFSDLTDENWEEQAKRKLLELLGGSPEITQDRRQA